MEFAEFAAWRKRVGITQEELAERWAGVTRTTIQNWESGATPIPRAVQSACAIWERRLKQENGKLGPVTLIYADGPMFIDPYGPRRRLAMMQQEPYQTNTAALARVRQLWGSEHFYNPFIIEKDGSDLWNAAELRRVVDGDDAGAPTLENLLRRLAKRVKQTSDLFVRSGPKLLTGTAAKQRQAQIEALAEEIADVAAGRPIRRETVDELLIRLRGLGKFPPDELVFNIAQAFVDASTGNTRTMTNIRSIDMMFLDDIFQMGDGYVLNFSDHTIARFFAGELNVDFDDPAYMKNGTSKAKRLRCFLQTVDKPTVVRTLNALWEYREAIRERVGKQEDVPNARGRFVDLISRLSGAGSTNQSNQVFPTQSPSIDRAVYAKMVSELQSLSAMDRQTRGYAFERFLIRLFDNFRLEAREGFRLCGEQIDGSFVLNGETYLVEGKWQNALTGVADLHTFHGKVEQKAAWTRGLFISYSGFTEEGLQAFGRGKRVICMDGYDLHEALTRKLPIDDVIKWKVRKAAETGLAFVRVRDLFT